MKSRVFFLIALLVLSGLFLGGLSSVHEFGDPGQAVMDDFYLTHAQQDKSANNVVTSIVFDYRGFDTLGEAAVLFTAVSSVVLLFRKGGPQK
jgi:multisubunit Na+/H+ antiporter MnhB subunit